MSDSDGKVDPMASLGLLYRRYRRDRQHGGGDNSSITRFEEEWGWSANSVGAWERAEREPSIIQGLRLASYLGIPIDELARAVGYEKLSAPNPDAMPKRDRSSSSARNRAGRSRRDGDH